MKKGSFKKISTIALAAIMVATAIVMSSCSPSETTKNGVTTKSPHNDKVNSVASIESNNGAVSDVGEPGEAMTEAEEEIDLDSMIFSDEEIANGYAISGDTLIILSDSAMKNYTHSKPAPWYEQRAEITRIIINKGVTNIGRFAFFTCANVHSVSIPEGVTYIGGSAFEYCQNLTSITIPEGVTFIDDSAFGECIKLNSIVIPEGVTTLGDAVFMNCDALEQITLPASLTHIASVAFRGCRNLTKIIVDENNEKFSSDEDGVLFNKDKSELLQYHDIGEETYVIPDSVKTIGDDAFQKSFDLKTVIIPNSVTVIGARAFEYSAISSITIPNSVTRIEIAPFKYCDNLTSVNFNGTQAEWLAIEGHEYLSDYTVNFNS